MPRRSHGTPTNSHSYRDRCRTDRPNSSAIRLHERPPRTFPADQRNARSDGAVDEACGRAHVDRTETPAWYTAASADPEGRGLHDYREFPMTRLQVKDSTRPVSRSSHSPSPLGGAHHRSSSLLLHSDFGTE